MPFRDTIYAGGVAVNRQYAEKCLAVDSDIQNADLYVLEWAAHNIKMDRTDSMTEAIKYLLTNDYIFVGINGDAVDFMPLLSTMRSVTNTPIMIATGSFTTEMEIAALDNGADLFARWHDSPCNNVESVLAHISRVVRRSQMPRPDSKVMVYQKLLIAPLQRNVFVGNERIDLTRQEFDLLYVLMTNPGVALTYKQIYGHVWGDEYEDTDREMLRSAIKRLRIKLKIDPSESEYIETVREVGYRFPLAE